MITFRELGTGLRVLREGRGLSQRTVEGELSWPAHSLSNYELGRPASLRRLLTLLDFYKASFEDLQRAMEIGTARTPTPDPAKERSAEVPRRGEESPVDRAIAELRTIPRDQLATDLHRFIATMVEKTVREDPQRVLDALKAATRSAEDA